MSPYIFYNISYHLHHRDYYIFRNIESPTRSSDSILETIAHQEEVIKANKDILEQLYADIAELEGRKHKLEEDRYNLDKESESSRDALSEINALAQLESELTMKNRHIRKLLGDVKVRSMNTLPSFIY